MLGIQNFFAAPPAMGDSWVPKSANISVQGRLLITRFAFGRASGRTVEFAREAVSPI